MTRDYGVEPWGPNPKSAVQNRSNTNRSFIILRAFDPLGKEVQAARCIEFVLGDQLQVN